MESHLQYFFDKKDIFFLHTFFIFSLPFLSLINIFFPIKINDNIEYFSVLFTLFLYLIYSLSDLILFPIQKNHLAIFFYLINISFLFQLLSSIQISIFPNIFNIFLSSYSIFNIIKYTINYLESN